MHNNKRTELLKRSSKSGGNSGQKTKRNGNQVATRSRDGDVFLPNCTTHTHARRPFWFCVLLLFRRLSRLCRFLRLEFRSIANTNRLFELNWLQWFVRTELLWLFSAIYTNFPRSKSLDVGLETGNVKRGEGRAGGVG